MSGEICVELGQIVVTRGVDQMLETGEVGFGDVSAMIKRHGMGDWGEVGKEDWNTNDRAARDGERLLSAYSVGGVKFWVITEWDRSVTTVLLPEEY